MSTTLLIEIDPDACIGYGECVNEDPDAVALGPDGCARVRVERIDAERAARLCECCPAGAIRRLP
jgi:ferredoxin